MITIAPIARALVPVDDEAAARISARNYDEFQGDREIWSAIRRRPDSVLAVTMAHCDVESVAAIGEGDSEPSLRRAAGNMERLRASPLTAEARGVLFIYEIVGPARPGVRQIGLGGLARTDEIRTESNPHGSIVRNEGVREPKARGRARLIEATGAIIGMVNNAVPDARGELAALLEREADSRSPDLTSEAEDGYTHRVWLIEDPGRQGELTGTLAAQPEAYVADGNHRSAAAAMLGREHFLAVFFPLDRMGIEPYNRLLEGVDASAAGERMLAANFEVRSPNGGAGYQPQRGVELGLYVSGPGWRVLEPRPGSYDEGDAAASVAHGVAQRLLFSAVLGIDDAADARIRYVGADRDADWLAAEVDAGRAAAAVTLAPVTMAQFAEVCRQGGMMPPKSTWFVPKVRSGLVMALLD
ncbi:MAG: DUF1015 family protein [Gemmatimonadota bacterium]